MSVVNQQVADQTTFNEAFLSRLGPETSTVAKVRLENAGSTPVDDVQKSIGEVFAIVGSSEGDANALIYANENYIASGDNHKTAIEKLDAEAKAQDMRLDDHDSTLASHLATLIELDGRLDVVEPKVTALETLTADHETRLDTAESEIDALQTLTADHETRLDTAESEIDTLQTLTADHETRLDTAESEIDTLQTLTNDHETRLDVLETQDQTIGGNKTFSGNVVVAGDLTVNGTLTSINSTDLEVVDRNITLNKGGNDASAEGAGLSVKRTSDEGLFLFDTSLVSKWKVGVTGFVYEVLVSGVAQVVSGLKDFVSGLKADTINESTLAAGVTVESVLIKAGLVGGRDVSADGAALDAAVVNIADHESRLDSAEPIITALVAESASHDLRLDVLEPKVTALETLTADHETRLDTAESEIDALQTLTNDHETRLDTAESEIDALQTLTGAHTTNIAALDASLVAHVADTNNPHAVTAAQVGLDQVTNHPQLRIEAGHFNTFTPKLVPNANDLILMEDSEDGFNKVKVKFSAFGGGGGGGGGKSTHAFKINGNYSGLSNKLSVDGFFIAPENIRVTDVLVYAETVGAAGTLELDVKAKPFGSGAFTSIFLTTPKILPAAGNNAVVGVGDTVTGCTAPVLTTLPFVVAAKTQLRLDLITSFTANATTEGCGLILVYEKV